MQSWGGKSVSVPYGQAAPVDITAGPLEVREMDYNPEREYRVTGQLLAFDSVSPLVDAQVALFDRDVLADDMLGQASTNGNGRFEVAFLEKAFRSKIGSGLEHGPDLYLEVHTLLSSPLITEVLERDEAGFLSEFIGYFWRGNGSG